MTFRSELSRKDTRTMSNRFLKRKGFSLVEVLLIMVLLSATVLPFTLMLTQTAQLSRGVNIQSTRGLALSSAADQMDASRADYYDAFHDTTMSTSLSESGQTIPMMTVVDTTNSNSFNKTSYLYSYNNSSDAVSSPRSMVALFNSSDVLRMRCGNASGLIDTSAQVWVGDQAYDSSKKQPGYYTVGTTGTVSSDILNATGTDDAIFQYWRETTNMEYRFNVPNGSYNVMLYFSEMSGVTTRYLNISLEGVVQNSSPYSVYQTTGGNYFGNIVAYDATVSDGVLNVNLDRDASAGTNNPRLSGIVIKKRLLKP